MSKKLIETGSCGCQISGAKAQLRVTVHICRHCKGKCCNSHYFFNVDGNNSAITRALFTQGVCIKCAPKHIQEENNWKSPTP